MTGFEKPYVNAFRQTKDTILDYLPRLKMDRPLLEVCCYLDLKEHLRTVVLSERLLLLVAAQKVSRQLRIDEWRRLLSDEFECSRDGLEKALDNILEAIRRDERNAILYGGFVRPLKERLAREGTKSGQSISRLTGDLL